MDNRAPHLRRWATLPDGAPGTGAEGEARAAIRAHRWGDGVYGGGEAVAHYGGADRLIADALRNRRRLRGESL